MLSALLVAGFPAFVATTLKTSAPPAQPVVGLFGVTASLAGWSWFGTGAPCERGSNLPFVAPFFRQRDGRCGPVLLLLELR